MEQQNLQNWRALVNLVRVAYADGRSLPRAPWDVLDIGSHTGGLLSMFLLSLDRGNVKSLAGVEPILEARKTSGHRLENSSFFGTIEEVPSQSVDIVVSHETIYLVPDLPGWMQELKRILRPTGGAFIALGSHGENDAWLRWKYRLEELYDHKSFEYQPMEILEMGHAAGFDMELSRLFPEPRRSMRYSPPEDGWGEFNSAEEALGHRDKKLVFTFYPKR